MGFTLWESNVVGKSTFDDFSDFWIPGDLAKWAIDDIDGMLFSG